MPQDRSEFIGASEIAGVMGLSPWTTPLQIWAQKTGKLPPNDLSEFEAAEWGVRLEEVVAKKFSQKNKVKLIAYKKRFVHPKYKYISCELDRLIVDSDELVEVKTCSGWQAKKWSGDEIPTEYVLQVNLQLGLSGRSKGHLAVLIGGNKYLEKFIEFDQELYDQQVGAAVVFWEQFVLKDIPPMAIAGDSETLLHLFPESEPNTLRLDGELAEELDVLVEDRLGALESIRHAKEGLEAVEARIKQILAENEEAETLNVRVTWKSRTVKAHEVKESKFRVLNTKKREK